MKDCVECVKLYGEPLCKDLPMGCCVFENSGERPEDGCTR